MNDIKKILVPIDFSKSSPKIVDYAKYFTGKHEAKLVILNVVESIQNYEGFAIPHISLAQLSEGLLQSAEKKMADFVEEHMGQPIAYEAKVLMGYVDEEINRFAQKEGVDLIIMGTHGYRGFEHALFGSVAEKVVKTAPCPVLLINPFKEEASRRLKKTW